MSCTTLARTWINFVECGFGMMGATYGDGVAWRSVNSKGTDDGQNSKGIGYGEFRNLHMQQIPHLR